jgi:hypothetical protein
LNSQIATGREESSASARHEDIAMRQLAEEEVAELLTALPPAPPGWVQAAIELPQARKAIDELVTQALADQARRDAILADLEAALRTAGVEPRRQLVDRLRGALGVPAQ